MSMVLPSALLATCHTEIPRVGGDDGAGGLDPARRAESRTRTVNGPAHRERTNVQIRPDCERAHATSVRNRVSRALRAIPRPARRGSFDPIGNLAWSEILAASLGGSAITCKPRARAIRRDRRPPHSDGAQKKPRLDDIPLSRDGRSGIERCVLVRLHSRGGTSRKHAERAGIHARPADRTGAARASVAHMSSAIHIHMPVEKTLTTLDPATASPSEFHPLRDSSSLAIACDRRPSSHGGISPLSDHYRDSRKLRLGDADGIDDRRRNTSPPGIGRAR